jgi:multicomponent Na+:H+ antiporter subunit D
MDILLWGGVITFIVGEAAAFTSRDLYRLLGFSSIGMFGLILASFSLGGQSGIWAGVMIMIGHIISKPVLFSIAGILKHKDRDSPLSVLDGLLGRSRTAGLIFIIAALMLLGMPPSPIFWGKYFLFSEAGADGNWLLVGMIIIGTILEAGYIGKLLWRVMPWKYEGKPFRMPIPTGLMAVLAIGLGIVLGVMPFLIQDLLDQIVTEMSNPMFFTTGVI